MSASNDYNKIKEGTAEVSLEHADQAGHYVVTAEREFESEMFLNVQAKEDVENLLYMITYSYYPFSANGGSKNPYKVISPDQHEISYKKNQEDITFKVAPVKIGKQNPAGIEIEFIDYTIGVALT